MNTPLLIIVSISVLLNIAFIKFKFEKKRYMDGIVDSTLLVLVMVLFSGSFSALTVGTMSSMMISVYLWFSPPKISTEKNKEFTDGIKTKIKEPGSFEW